jgi:hypothetical protein
MQILHGECYSLYEVFMALILPLAVWGMLWWWFSRHGEAARAAIIKASLAWAVILVILTEGLSLFRLLTAPVLLVAWAC